MRQLFQQNPLLMFGMIIANIAISAWCLMSDPVINYDGVLYVTTADLILNNQWQAAIGYYNWPFYSIAIAAVAKILFLSSETAAHVLNVGFVISLCFAFVCIVSDLSNGDKRLIWIAALIIVFFPSITKYRSFVIRDFAYLSFYLWSLRYLLLYCQATDKKQQIKNITAWAVFSILAILFRIEGVIFLLVTAYFLLLFTDNKFNRLKFAKLIIRVLTLLLIGGGVLLAWWYLNDKYEPTILMSQKLGKDIHNVWDVFVMNLSQSSADQKLTAWQYTQLFTNNIAIVFYELIRRLAVFYLLFVIYAYAKGLILNDYLSKRLWWVYVITNIGILLAFSLYNNFFVSRYELATVLTLLIFAPFGINSVLFKLNTHSKLNSNATLKKLATTSVLLVLVIVSIEGLNVKSNKPHIKQAGHWIGKNIAKNDTLYSNSKLAVYYAKRGAKANLEYVHSNAWLQYLIDNGYTNQFKYIALANSKDNKQEQAFVTLFTKLYGAPIYHRLNSENKKRAISIFKTTQR